MREEGALLTSRGGLLGLRCTGLSALLAVNVNNSEFGHSEMFLNYPLRLCSHLFHREKILEACEIFCHTCGTIYIIRGRPLGHEIGRHWQMQESVLPCTMHMFHSTITDTAPVTAGKHCLPDNICRQSQKKEHYCDHSGSAFILSQYRVLVEGRPTPIFSFPPAALAAKEVNQDSLIREKKGILPWRGEASGFYWWLQNFQ